MGAPPLPDILMTRRMQLAVKCVLAAWLVAMAPVVDAQTVPAGPGAPYPRPKGRFEVDVERNLMIPMRDGVRLATDLYRPRGVSGPLPTVLIRLPYNKAAYRAATVPADFFASH
ncbi:MAG TPA: CocE/NonD family hydrolase, partial [Gemmatimonadaceae bacterium]|nr:CocE/NonD family hydrolase [Gemmatimonadaceae bacterium]